MSDENMKVHSTHGVFLLLLLLPCLLDCATILDGPGPHNCTQEGLRCDVTIGNCMDPGWLIKNKYTPSAPEGLEVWVDRRQDRNGRVQPVLVAQWKLKDEGSIQALKATELQVHVRATNQQLCVRYSFPDVPDKPLPQRNPFGQQWSFSVDSVVVDPGQTYWVSVFNVPKPELDYTNYDVSKEVQVPNCQDAKMKETDPCVKSGSLWNPNITLEVLSDHQTSRSRSRSRSMLAVSFNTDPLSDRYLVLVRCSVLKHNEVFKKNETSLTVKFQLDDWQRSCCVFHAEIAPFFNHCGNDCDRRQGRPLNLCRVKNETTPDTTPGPAPYYWSFAFVAVLLCAVLGCVWICRRPHTGQADLHKPLVVGGEEPRLPRRPPKVLVIYSQDHRLYRDVVLKLCAFLRARCGVEVLVDLLDSAGLGTVGPLRWLQWQRQQLTGPQDKMLVLCSPGVQAKWRAMCGQGRVMLREDVLSPTDDMLIPFLNLLLPDMHQAAPLGKYMVAYFDDVCGEGDVPSVFHLGVKYKLMKHFEELYFRILDMEKYQPGQVNHIQGISGDEYFTCPSGRALRNAIETFQAFQLENPRWFEAECVGSEEEAVAESLAVDPPGPPQIPPVLECVPLLREGPPVYVQDMELNQNHSSVHVLTPEVDAERPLASVVELQPRLHAEGRRPFHPNAVTPSSGVLEARVRPYVHHTEPVYVTEPLPREPPRPSENRPHILLHTDGPAVPTDRRPPAQGSPTRPHKDRRVRELPPEARTVMTSAPATDEEEESECLLSPPLSHRPSTQALQNLAALQRSLGFGGPPGTPSLLGSSWFSVAEESEYPSSLEASGGSQPVEVDEGDSELREPPGIKGPNSGSDQGYISKTSTTQPGSPCGGMAEEQDPLVALVRLQEELVQRNHGYAGRVDMA